MIHYETRRLVPGAKYAVLFVHGIAGTPNHFRISIPLEELVPEDWSVYNIRLPGHGYGVREFGKSDMDQWRHYAMTAFRELAERHEKVLIVGHSMGTLFGMQMSIEMPEKVAGLFLIAVPMRPWLRLFGIMNCLRLAFGGIREDRQLEVATRNVCGLETTPWVWQYIPWIPRFLELFAEIARTEKKLGQLSVPCIAWQSEKDELVSNFAAPVLEKCGKMEVRYLPDSTHFYYAPKDAALVREEFIKWIEKVLG